MRAPFDGTAGIRLVNVGDYVKDGTDLLALEDARQMLVDTLWRQALLLAVEEQNKVAMRLSRSGLPKAEALRQAMIAVRTGKRADGTAVAGWKEFWAHPAAWSPFVLVAADGS